MHNALVFLSIVTGLTVTLPLVAGDILPEVYINASDVLEVRGGDPLYLLCEVVSSSPANVVWYKDSKVLLQAYHYGVFSVNAGLLHAYTTTQSEEGVYSCVAFSQLGHSQSKYVTVRLTGAAFTSSIPSSIFIHPGQSLLLNCHVTSWSQHVQVHWTKGGSPIGLDRNCVSQRFLGGSNTSGCVSVVGGDLIMSKLNESDSGVYRCSALVATHLLAMNTRITVTDVFFEHPFPPSSAVDVNAEIKFSCAVNSSPNWTVTGFTWSKNGLDLNLSDHALWKTRVQTNDSGVYKCDVKIQNKNSAIRIMSQQINITVAGRPGPVRIKLTPQFNFSILVQWTVPSDNGGFSLLRYTLELVQLVHSGELTRTANRKPVFRTTVKKSLLIEGFEPFSSYRLLVWASNQLGGGKITGRIIETSDRGQNIRVTPLDTSPGLPQPMFFLRSHLVLILSLLVLVMVISGGIVVVIIIDLLIKRRLQTSRVIYRPNRDGQREGVVILDPVLTGSSQGDAPNKTSAVMPRSGQDNVAFQDDLVDRVKTSDDEFEDHQVTHL